MNNVLKMAVNAFVRRNSENIIDEEKMELIEEIRLVSKSLNNAYKRFEFESDNDLIEASIYEIEALKARYRHLLQKAKEMEAEIPRKDLLTLDRREKG